MTVIAHLSDLHFGASDPAIVELLVRDLHDIAPDVMVVSGDLTQRAKPEQFASARAFLNRIPCDQIVVPGNHDVPLYNVFRRFTKPLHGYRAHITPDLLPAVTKNRVALLGVNTARSFTWKNGRISHSQMQIVHSYFCSLPPSLLKVLVTHHPFLAPPSEGKRPLVGRAFQALKMAHACDLNMLLAGHFHVSYAGGAEVAYTLGRRSLLVIQAGTATSKRFRNEPNAYNVIRVRETDSSTQTAEGHVEVEVRRQENGRFCRWAKDVYGRSAGRWERVAS